MEGHALETLCVIVIGAATLVILGFTLVISVVYQRINADTVKRAAVLRQSEDRLRSLVRNSSDIITVLQTDGSIRYVSPSIERILGYKPEDLSGKNQFDYIYPEDVVAVRAAFTNAIKNPAFTFSIEYKFKHADNSWVCLESVSNNFCDLSVKGLVVNSRNITQRKQAQQHLALQHAVTSALAESITLVEVTQKILQAICETLGWDLGEFWSVDQQTNLLRCAEIWHSPLLEVQKFKAITWQTTSQKGVGLLGRVWATGQPVWIADIVQDTNFLRASVAAESGLHGALTFPILLGHQILGVIVFFSRRISQPDQNLLEILAAIGSQIGQFIKRKQAEEALQKEQEFLKVLLDTVEAGIVACDSEGVVTIFNRITREFHGLPQQPLSTDEWAQYYDLYLPDGKTPMKKEDIPLFRALQGERVSNLEMMLVPKHGTARTLLASGQAMVDPHGRKLGAVVAMHDITYRVQAESELRESEERFRHLSEASFEAVAISEQGKILDANGNYAEMFGYKPSEVLGMNAMELTALEDRDRVKQMILSGNDTPYEIVCIRKDGTVFQAEIRAKTLTYQGRIARRVTAIQDITKRKQAEKSLQQANEKLRGWVNELEQRNREIALLGEMSEILQACLTVEEAYTAITQLVQPLFPQTSGGIFLISTSKNLAEGVATWGSAPLPSQEVFTPHECWALRRGQVHWVEDTHRDLLCQHLHQPLPAESLCVPMMAQGEALGVLYLSSLELGRLTQTKQQLATTVAEQIALALANLKLRETLQNQSIRDSLTGLFNRRYMEESLEREMHRCDRKQQPLSIIMLDVDHFKRFNDTFGHEAGDAVLRELGQFLQRHVRKSDIACRYGGEELTLIMPESSLDAVRQRAEQIREGVKHLQVQHDRHLLGVITLSLGIACFPEHGITSEAVMQAADAALYRAKKQGRDRVICAS